MPTWEETSYPVPLRPLRVACLTCGTYVAGGHRGSRNIRSILKVVKAHDDESHGYDPSVIQAITTAVDEINKGAPVPRRIGRLAVDLASSANSLGSWQRQAEILEQHIAVLVDQKSALEAATEELRHSRDHALAERDALRHQLTEAQKEIDVLRGVRDALQAELIKAQPSRRTTGFLAEIAKASASAVVGALVAVGVPGALGLNDAKTDATTVVHHADVVITECNGATP
jgi:hypothetical protein